MYVKGWLVELLPSRSGNLFSFFGVVCHKWVCVTRVGIVSICFALSMGSCVLLPFGFCWNIVFSWLLLTEFGELAFNYLKKKKSLIAAIVIKHYIDKVGGLMRFKSIGPGYE